MDGKEEYKLIVDNIKANKFLSTPLNNKLLLEFIKAKQKGEFGRIVYDTICEDGTLVKKARNLAKIERHFKKDFYDITEAELLKYRDLMNDDKIFASQTMVNFVDEKIRFKIMPTKKPLKFRTKEDYSINFKEFYRFIIEYKYKKEGVEISDISRFFKLRRPKDFRDVVVEFMDDDEVITLLNNIKNRKFKTIVQLSLMSGARPCEIINVRYGKSNNLYKNKEKKWVIHLPKIKRISFKKFPFVVDMYEDELYPYFNSLKLKDGALVFNTTEATFRRLMLYYTEKYLGKRYSPKILRKTARMMRTNAGYSEQWINKLLGHAPGTKVQAHYVNQGGVEGDPVANEKLKTKQYPSIKKDYDKLKLELQATREQMQEMGEYIYNRMPSDSKKYYDKMVKEKKKGKIKV